MSHPREDDIDENEANIAMLLRAVGISREPGNERPLEQLSPTNGHPYPNNYLPAPGNERPLEQLSPTNGHPYPNNYLPAPGNERPLEQLSATYGHPYPNNHLPANGSENFLVDAVESPPGMLQTTSGEVYRESEVQNFQDVNAFLLTMRVQNALAAIKNLVSSAPPDYQDDLLRQILQTDDIEINTTSPSFSPGQWEQTSVASNAPASNNPYTFINDNPQSVDFGIEERLLQKLKMLVYSQEARKYLLSLTSESGASSPQELHEVALIKSSSELSQNITLTDALRMLQGSAGQKFIDSPFAIDWNETQSGIWNVQSNPDSSGPSMTEDCPNMHVDEVSSHSDLVPTESSLRLNGNQPSQPELNRAKCLQMPLTEGFMTGNFQNSELPQHLPFDNVVLQRFYNYMLMASFQAELMARQNYNDFEGATLPGGLVHQDPAPESTTDLVSELVNKLHISSSNASEPLSGSASNYDQQMFTDSFNAALLKFNSLALGLVHSDQQPHKLNVEESQPVPEQSSNVLNQAINVSSEDPLSSREEVAMYPNALNEIRETNCKSLQNFDAERASACGMLSYNDSKVHTSSLMESSNSGDVQLYKEVNQGGDKPRENLDLNVSSNYEKTDELRNTKLRSVSEKHTTLLSDLSRLNSNESPPKEISKNARARNDVCTTSSKGKILNNFNGERSPIDSKNLSETKTDLKVIPNNLTGLSGSLDPTSMQKEIIGNKFQANDSLRVSLNTPQSVSFKSEDSEESRKVQSNKTKSNASPLNRRRKYSEGSLRLALDLGVRLEEEVDVKSPENDWKAPVCRKNLSKYPEKSEHKKKLPAGQKNTGMTSTVLDCTQTSPKVYEQTNEIPCDPVDEKNLRGAYACAQVSLDKELNMNSDTDEYEVPEVEDAEPYTPTPICARPMAVPKKKRAKSSKRKESKQKPQNENLPNPGKKEYVEMIKNRVSSILEYAKTLPLKQKNSHIVEKVTQLFISEIEKKDKEIAEKQRRLREIIDSFI